MTRAKAKRARIKRPKKGPRHDLSSTPKSIWGILGFFIVISLLYFLLVKFFVIEKIDCIDLQTDQMFACDHFDDLKNKSLFFTNFDQQDSFKQVVYDQANNKIYQIIDYKKELPDKLIVFLSERQLAYRIKIENQADYLVNVEGRVKENDPQFQLPEASISVNWQDEILVDDQINPQLHHFTYSLLEALKKIEYVKVNFETNEEIKIFLKGSRVAILDYDADPKLAIIKLEMVLNEVDFESFETEVKEIDLRFKMPVLR